MARTSTPRRVAVGATMSLPRLAPADQSMRVLEFLMAGVAIVAAVALTVLR
jgi:hypothetical protein